MSDATVEVPGANLLTPVDRTYVLDTPEANLRAELANQVRLRRIAEGQCQAHETELDRVLAERQG